MKALFLLFLIAVQSIYAQTEIDSLKFSHAKIIDSLKIEIEKNIHNYEAIREYYFQTDDPIFDEKNAPKFYDSLFHLIEKDKNIQPEYYSFRAMIFYSQGEEKIKFFRKGYLKFPKDYSINSELGDYYYKNFIESENKKNKSLYADSTRIHLDNFTFKNPFQFQKIKNAVELYQVYYFQNELVKMQELEKEILDKPFFGINLSTYLSKSDLKNDITAVDKTMSFFSNIEYFNQYKEKFGIKNHSQTYFNFILYRSSFKPLLIGLEERKGKYFISYLLSNIANKIEQPFETKTREITRGQFQNFISILTKQNTKKSSVAMQHGYDGSSWYLESKLKGSLTLQEIWSPQIHCTSNNAECSIIKACLYLIKLSGLKTTSRKIDQRDYQYDPNEPDGFMIW